MYFHVKCRTEGSPYGSSIPLQQHPYPSSPYTTLPASNTYVQPSTLCPTYLSLSLHPSLESTLLSPPQSPFSVQQLVTNPAPFPLFHPKDLSPGPKRGCWAPSMAVGWKVVQTNRTGAVEGLLSCEKRFST